MLCWMRKAQPKVTNFKQTTKGEFKMSDKTNPFIEASVLSVQQSEFTNRETGERRKMWRVYVADATGAVGSVWATEQYFPGDLIKLGLAVNREGKFTARILK